MSKYLKHLEQMSVKETFGRKVDYLRYNLSAVLPKEGRRGFSVLEIGPGMGESIWYLNKIGIKGIDVVDNDRGVFNHVKRNFKTRRIVLNKNTTLIESKLGEYDLILMIQVLEHMPIAIYGRTIQTLYKHLKRGGNLVLVVPNANNPLGVVERYADLQHHTSFTEQSLKDLITNSGIKNFAFKIREFEIPPYSLVNVVRIGLQKLLHLLLLAVMIVNGGNFFRVMTPNIMLLIKKR